MNLLLKMDVAVNQRERLFHAGLSVLFGALALWAWVSAWIGRKLAAARAETQKAMFQEQLRAVESRYEKEARQLETDRVTAQRDAQLLGVDNTRARRKVHHLRKEMKSLQHQLSQLQSWDGQLWERPLSGQPPQFIPASERPTRLISILNLKGGVGKTTLTANLGVTLARRGKRVLLVDLDFQCSLTGLCIGADDRRLLRQKGLSAGRLLDTEGGPTPTTMLDLLHPVRGLPAGAVCDVIPADDRVAEAEHRAQARWLLKSMGVSSNGHNNGRNGQTTGPDARFFFRQAFHATGVADPYDYILFDCPPRLTTACINALGCSDYLLVPVLLDRLSLEAMPRTLNYLDGISHVSGAQLLGAIGNRVERTEGKLSPRHQAIYDTAMDGVQRRGLRSCPFRAVVENSVEIEDAANDGRIAAARDEGMALFAEAADALERTVENESRGNAELQAAGA